MSAPILPKSAAPNNWLSTGISGSTLYGSSTARDQLSAKATNITLAGGGLDDTYIAYDPSTKIVEAASSGIDTVQTWGSGYTLGANVENLTLMGTSNSTATGNSGSNLITGNDGNNRIVTGGGNDVLVGSKGADTYVPTKEASSVTWITNFKATGTTVDKIDLRGFGLSGFSSIQSRMTQIGTDLQIDLGNGQKVMLENKTKGELTAANFDVEVSTTSTTTTTPSGSTTTTTTTTTTPTAPLSDLVLTFADEFNSLNLYSTWQPYDGWGNRTLSGNGEKQLYVDPKYQGLGIQPFSVKDGILTITAAKTAPENVSKLWGYQYTSGMLSSHASFSQQYGYFEMRAQVSTEQGMWPAFWMLSTNGKWPPELDIVEVVGKQPTAVHQTVHTSTGKNVGKATWASEDLANAYHTFGMDWTASTITFYFDGKKTYSTPTPADMHTSMYMMVNMAVGGNWPGSPDSTTDWSKTKMNVDYIRAYKHSPDGTAPLPPTTTTPTTEPTTTEPAPAPEPTPEPTPTSASTSTPTPAGLKAVISNATNPLDLSDSYAAAVTAAGTSTTYTGSQMAIAGVASSTSVSVAYDANGGITVTNKAAWNAVKNATVKSDLSGGVTVNNFVDAEIALGNGNNTVTVNSAKRGSIVTGSGNDKITVKALGLGTTDNVMKINAGDGANTISFTGPVDTKTTITSGSGIDTISLAGLAGATVAAGGGNDVISAADGIVATIDAGDGDDQVTLSGQSRGTVNGGNGNDKITVSGQSTAVNAGAGDDRVIVTTAAAATLTGGAGRDTFEFSAGVHATITDFNATEDSLVLNGITTSSVLVTQGTNSTVLDLGNGSSVTLAGASLSAAALGFAPPAPEPLVAKLSNTMDSSNLTGAFTAATTTKTYTASQLNLSGVDPSASVSVTYDANGLTVTNKGLWNAVKNARVESESSGNLTINNFVDAQVCLTGAGDSKVNVTSAKRGSITTGAGNDQISVTGYSNGTTDNVMKINAGDGNNTISFSGASNTKTAITTGGGADKITVSGQAGATINAGAGNDRIVTATSGAVTAIGGAGNDIFEFIRGAHATISDFNASQDSIVIRGGSTSNVQVKAGNGYTLLDMGNGASVMLAGVTAPSGSINITYA